MATQDYTTQPQQSGAPTVPPTASPPPIIVQMPQPAPAMVEVEEKLPEGVNVNAEGRPELIIYSHSPLFYWWPVWVVGYVMALMTYLNGQDYQMGAIAARFHPNQNVGVIFTLTVFLVILVTNVTLRGLASALVILLVIIGILVAALMDWWEEILNMFGNLHIYLNMNFYLIFSTLMLGVWLAAFFVFDRLSYWRIRPGQVTQEYVLGAAAKSYDTDNLVLEKFRDDLFRHWMLGFGSGDLHVRPFGANREDLLIPNVLFVGRKVETIQHLIATQPDGFGKVTVR